MLIFLKPRVSEWHDLAEEYLEIDKQQADELFDLLFPAKFSWAMINLTTGRIFAGFDEVIYKE